MTGQPGDLSLLEAIERDGRVAVTIDKSASWPYRALLLRGDAGVEMLDDVTEEYAAAARRDFGDEQGDAWVSQLQGKPMARISVTPTWATVPDFQTRFPSALTS